MMRAILALVALVGLAACGGEEGAFTAWGNGGGKAENNEENDEEETARVCAYGNGMDSDAGDSLESATRPASISDDTKQNATGWHDGSIGSQDADYWIVKVEDATQMPNDLLYPWASAALSHVDLHTPLADSTLEFELCVSYRWNDGGQWTPGCLGGKEKQGSDGKAACCATVNPKTNPGVILELPTVAGPGGREDSGELVISARPTQKSTGCGAYVVTWGARYRQIMNLRDPTLPWPEHF